MIKLRFKYSLLDVRFIVMFLLCIGCCRSADIEDKLDVAERLMEDRSDSALILLDDVDTLELNGRKLRARYALLKSMALDKNYIDTTSFEVLQPAIDYYLKKGNANEKLMTYYYQGRIHENAGADDLAMQSYLKGLKYSHQVSDSLTLARLLVAQGALYYKEYRLNNLVDNNLQAAQIYHLIGNKTLQLKCNLRALHGAILQRNRSMSDSLLISCKSLIKESPSLEREMQRTVLLYAVYFENLEEIQKCVEEFDRRGLTKDVMMSLAVGYSKIGHPQTGLRYLEEVKIRPDDLLDSLSYWSINTEII